MSLTRDSAKLNSSVAVVELLRTIQDTIKNPDLLSQVEQAHTIIKEANDSLAQISRERDSFRNETVTTKAKHAAREAELDKKEDDLTGYESALNKRTNDVEKKERDSSSRQSRIAEKEKEHAAIDKAHADREAKLKAFETSLNERQGKLDTREDEIAKRETKLRDALK